jgi:hypothetical protein
LYCYDFLELLERAVQLKWEEYAKLRPRSDVLRPRDVVSVVELVVVKKGTPQAVVEEGAAEEWASSEEEQGLCVWVGVCLCVSVCVSELPRRHQEPHPHGDTKTPPNSHKHTTHTHTHKQGSSSSARWSVRRG